MNPRQHHNYRHSLHTRLGLVILAAFMDIGGIDLTPVRAWADQTGIAQVDSSNAGQITAVGPAFLEVEQRSYRLDPKLEIRAEGGQPMELTQLQVGMGVRLQLKEGTVFKVMVMNPR